MHIRPRRRAIPLILAAIVASLLAGCPEPRSWDSSEAARTPVPLGDVGTLTITHLKQGGDYLRLVGVIHNASDAPLWFRPPGPTTSAYGFQLHPLARAPMIRRAGGVVEPALALASGQDVAVELQWVIDPQESDADWRWQVTVDSLMCGERAVPTITIAMPAWDGQYLWQHGHTGGR